MGGITNKNTVIPDPLDTLKSTGVSIKFRHYQHCIEQAQKLGVSMSQYIRIVIEKDYEEYQKKKA